MIPESQKKYSNKALGNQTGRPEKVEECRKMGIFDIFDIFDPLEKA